MGFIQRRGLGQGRIRASRHIGKRLRSTDSIVGSLVIVLPRFTETPLSNSTSNTWLPWQRYTLLSRGFRPNTALESWLREPGSLTKRLREELGSIEVNLTDLYSQGLSLETSHRLGLHNRSIAMIREVTISHQGSVCFHARTYIPKSSMVRDTGRLRGWKNRSLGDFLFREPRQFYSELEFSHLMMGEQVHWARRRCHYLYNRPIMVCEYFPETSLCQWVR